VPPTVFCLWAGGGHRLYYIIKNKETDAWTEERLMDYEQLSTPEFRWEPFCKSYCSEELRMLFWTAGNLVTSKRQKWRNKAKKKKKKRENSTVTGSVVRKSFSMSCTHKEQESEEESCLMKAFNNSKKRKINPTEQTEQRQLKRRIVVLR